MNSGIVIESLIIDGILKGIGAVLSFLPIHIVTTIPINIPIKYNPSIASA